MSDITRTKVLEILEHNWTSLHNPDYTDEELGKALDFCISSLETDEAYDFMYEQPEWCKDCISREQAIKEFCKQTCETPNCRFRDKGIAHASCDEVDVLKRLPSVLPKATKNDLVVDWENYKDVDGNSLDDLILEVLQNNFDCGNTYGYKVADEIIGLLPSVTPQEPRWISVSEKLPNDRNWYLGIFKEPDTGWINPLPFICDYVGRETKATTKEFWILRGFTDRDEHIDYYFNLECVKWMPLPSSYREVKE